MEKMYLTPEIEIVELDVRSSLLADSDPDVESGTTPGAGEEIPGEGPDE